jgi:hypothetical protein
MGLTPPWLGPQANRHALEQQGARRQGFTDLRCLAPQGGPDGTPSIVVYSNCW